MKCTSVLGVLLGILSKSAWPGPVSCSGATAILDLGESSSLSYSKRVSLAVERWARDTQDCSGKWEIRYNNKCYELASQFATPCLPNKWLVLKKPMKADQGRFFPVTPECVEMPCPLLAVWWAPLQTCVRFEHEVCADGHVFRTDPFGDVFCGCPPRHGQLTEGADCHEYFQQGPCKSDEVLVFDADTDLGKCAPDLCYRENALRTAGIEKARYAARLAGGVTRKMFAPLNGTGPCLEWGSEVGRCAQSEDQHKLFSFEIDNESHLPTCVALMGSFGGSITAPDCPNFDPTTNECPGEATVEHGPRESYVKANRGTFYS